MSFSGLLCLRSLPPSEHQPQSNTCKGCNSHLLFIKPRSSEVLGGSESRFIVGIPDGDREPETFITQTETAYGKATSLSYRDPKDRYQKVVIKQDGDFQNIRFDNHPQPYWGVQDPDSVCEQPLRMIQHYRKRTCVWQLQVLQQRQQGNHEWEEFQGKLDWDHKVGNCRHVSFTWAPTQFWFKRTENPSCVRSRRSTSPKVTELATQCRRTSALRPSSLPNAWIMRFPPAKRQLLLSLPPLPWWPPEAPLLWLLQEQPEAVPDRVE